MAAAGHVDHVADGGIGRGQGQRAADQLGQAHHALRSQPVVGRQHGQHWGALAVGHLYVFEGRQAEAHANVGVARQHLGRYLRGVHHVHRKAHAGVQALKLGAHLGHQLVGKGVRCGNAHHAGAQPVECADGVERLLGVQAHAARQLRQYVAGGRGHHAACVALKQRGAHLGL